MKKLTESEQAGIGTINLVEPLAEKLGELAAGINVSFEVTIAEDGFRIKVSPEH